MKYLKTYKLFEQQTQKEYTQKDIDKRWNKKRGAIKKLSENIDKLRRKVSKDLQSGNEKEKLIATVVKIMDLTGERVGNKESSKEGRHGITNLKNKHVSINGNKVTLKYTGKSSVKHEKTFSNATIANILKEQKEKEGIELFKTEDGIQITSRQVNRYLDSFNITSKDLRGFKSNKLMIDELKNVGKVKEEKERKKVFNELLRKVADKIGHTPTTLRKHYLLPEIENNFYKHGSIGYVKMKL